MSDGSAVDTDPTGTPNAVISLDPTDSDGDGNPLTLDVPNEGVWTYDPVTDDLTFSPDAGFTNDPTSIVYTLTETQTGLTNTATVSADYVIQAPTAVADEDLANTAGAVTLDPIPGTAGQDSDPDGSIDPMTVSLVAPMGVTPTSVVFDANNDVTSFVIPNEGTWSVDETTGAITFTPLSTFTDDPTVISYNVEDNDGNQSTNDATVTIDYVPVAVADVSTGNTVGQDAVINVTGNDTDGDAVVDNTFVFGSTANPLPAGATTSGTPGMAGYSVIIPNEGVWTYDGSGGLTFNPDAGFTTDPTVLGYTISDAEGNTTSTTVTVGYTEVPPVANDDSVSGVVTGVDAVLTDISGNDTLSDGSAVDTDPTGTPNAVISLDPTDSDGDGNPLTLDVPNEGVWTYDPVTDDLTFSPDAGFTNDPTSIVYTLTETQTGLTNTATVSADYVIQAPTAVADEDLANTAGAVTLDPIPGTAGQDSDPDGSIDPMTVSLVAPMGVTPTSVVFDANNDVTSFVIPNEGTWSVDETTGAITFTPLSTFTDDPTVISYNVEDNDGNQSTNDATVTIDYVPVAVADVSTGNTVGQDAVINVTGNDTDGDAVVDNTFVFGSTANPLPAGATTSGTPGMAGYSVIIPNEGVWTYDGSGGLTFNPDAGFTTDPTVLGYTISDAEGNTTSTTVTVGYTEVPPVANDDSVSGVVTGVDAVLTDISGNDTLSDGSAVDTDPTGTPNAVISLDPTDSDGDGNPLTLDVPNEGVWTYDPVTDDLTFSPDAGFTNDPTSIVYTLTETQTGLTNTATVSADYVIQAPTAVADEDLANTAGAVTLDPIPGTAGQDSDPDGSIDPMTVSLVAPMGITPTSVVFDANNDVTSFVIPNEGTWSVDEATGAITFTPLSTFTDDPTVISYNVEDNDGNQSTNDATVTIDYVPVAVADVSTGNTVGQDAVINVTGNDTDGDAVVDNTFVFGSTANPLPAGATTSGTPGMAGYSVIIPNEGVWTYDGSGGLTFNPDAGFTTDPTVLGYTISDAQGNATSTTVTVGYTEVPPVANDDSVSGVVTGVDAVLTDISGNDTLSDGSAVDTTNRNNAVISLDPTDSDGDGNPLTLDVPNEGVWTYDPVTDDLTFSPDAGFTNDPTSIVYTLTETQTGLTNTATVSADYVIQAPTAVADEDLANAAGAVTLDPIPGTAGQDSDPDGSIDPMTVSLVAPMGITPTSVVFDANNDVTSFVIPNEGTWSVDEATGAITFTPLSTFTDDPTVISYNVEDNDGNQSTNNATVTIDYVPVAVADVSTGNTVGQDAVINVTGNDTDGDAVVDNTFVFGSTANPLPAGATTSGTPGMAGYSVIIPNEGVWTYDGSGGLTFNPDAGFTTDPTVIGYTISDAQGNTTSTTVTVDYTELPPVANNDSEDNGGLGFDTGDAVTIAILDNDDLSDGSQATTT